ncbi:tail fiber domain-containing protein [Bdellovibrio sp. HCB274]|uniref:tail fiber domain-containing protein n=1 Tax=Bdellovibrio sp. HCB274 TaxID=3394361 RepID=UPI0039B68C8E
MKKSFVTTTLLSLLTNVALAVSPGSLFTYEGVLTDSGGTPITSSQTVTFSVMYGSCVLYSESQTITPGSVGEFSAIVGTGTRTDTTNNTADRIFASAGSVNCQGASAVSMSGFTTRALRINVAGSTLTPDVAIGNIPMAINSQKLADKGPSDFMQVNSGTGTTQANLESILARYTTLDTLLSAYTGGTLTAQSATNFTGSLAGDVTGTQGATSVGRIKGVNVDMTGLAAGKILKYNGTAFSVADDATGASPGDASYAVKGIVQFDTNASISGVNITSGVVRVNVGTSADQIVKLDSMARLPAVDGSNLTNLPSQIPAGAVAGQVLSSTGSALQWITPSSTDNTKLPTAGGTMTGAIDMGSNNLTNVGYVTMSPNKSLHLSNNPADPSLSTADKGKIWFNSTSNQIKYWDGSSAQTLGVAGSGISSFNGQTGSSQSFGTIGTTGTGPNWSSSSNTHSLNIPLASSAGVSAGLLSKTEYDALAAKQAAGNYITALTGDVTAAGPGSAAAVIANSAVTSAKIADGTITATDMNFTGINSATANLVLNDGTGKFTSIGCSTVGHVLTWSASGFNCAGLSVLSPLLADSKIYVGNGSGLATQVYMSGDASLSNSGALTLATVGTAGTYSKVTVDAKGRVTSGVTNFGFANYTTATESTFTSSLGTSDKGTTWYNSTMNQIRYWDGSAAQSLGVAGTGVTNVSGMAPISVATGTSTPVISVAAATASSLGVMQAGSGLSVSSGNVSVLSAPDLSTITGTGLVQRTGASTYTAIGTLAPLNITGSSLGLNYGNGLFVNTGTLQVDTGTSANKILQLDSSARLPSVDGSQLTNVVASSLSSILPITQGGTGASTKSVAFNNLSPLTTKGDLHVHDGTNNVRMPAGTDGQLLTADSASANGLKWFAHPFYKNGGNSFGADATLGTTDAYGLYFITGGTDRMTITPTGRVGIGETAPNYNLVVNSTSATGTSVGIQNSASSRAYTLNVGAASSSNTPAGGFSIYDQTAGKARLLFDANGAAAIGGSITNLAGATGPGVLTLNGNGSTSTDSGILELNNPTASLGAGALGGKITFNASNNTGNKTLAGIQVSTDGVGGANGYGGKIMFTTKQDNTAGLNVNFVMSNNGSVGIGIGIPAYRLDVAGDTNLSSGYAYKIAGVNICTSAGCLSTSDRRLKEDIQPLENSLENILKLDGVSYFYSDKQRFPTNHQVGVIAQDVEKVFPEVVVTDEKTGMKAVAYDHLVAPLIEAVKSLYNKIVSSEEKIADQERRIASVEASQSSERQEIESLKKENEKLKKQNEKLEKDLNLIKSRLGL